MYDPCPFLYVCYKKQNLKKSWYRFISETGDFHFLLFAYVFFLQFPHWTYFIYLFFNKWVGQQHMLFIHQEFADPCHVPSPAWDPWGGSRGRWEEASLPSRSSQSWWGQGADGTITQVWATASQQSGISSVQPSVLNNLKPLKQGQISPAVWHSCSPTKPPPAYPGLNPSLMLPACPHAHGSLPFPELDTAISTVLWQNDGWGNKNVQG